MTLSHFLVPSALALGALTASAQAAGPQGELDLEQVGTQMLSLPADGPATAFTVAVQIGGAPYTLALQPYSLRAADFTVQVQGADGVLRPWEPDAPQTYRGTILGIEGSDVRASLTGGELRGTIRDQFQEYWGIQPAADFDPADTSGSHVVYHRDEVQHQQELTCGTLDSMIDPVTPGSGYAGTGLKLAEVAFDADFEFYQSNSSSVVSTVADIENVMNSVEQHYEDDCNVTFDITTIIVRTSAADPYSSTNASTMLNELTNHWNSQQSGWKRDVTHLMTGKNMSGSTIGIAWLNAICNNSAYGVSQSKFSFSLASRAALTAHEIGHNFSAQHCNGNPNGCKIMCSGLGGCNGINGFAPVSINSITNKANNLACLLDLAPPIATDWFDTFPSSINTDYWIVNDNVSISTAALNEPTPPNSLRLNANGSAAKDQDEIRTNFIPLNGPGPWFVSFQSQHIGVENGESLVCDYADISGQWNELVRITSDGVDQTTFTETVVQVPALGIGPEFRIRFRGEVSDSGDNWYVDDVAVGLNPPCAPAFQYCTAKTTSEGCPPIILSTGTASASSPNPFDIQAVLTIAVKPGLLFYGYAPAALPFQGGTLCVQPPTRRTPVQLSGGTIGFPCDGSYTFDMNAHIQSGVDPLLVPGSTANAQYWFRDNGVPSQTGLTGGLEFEICN